jgi:hypothetical protein
MKASVYRNSPHTFELKEGIPYALIRITADTVSRLFVNFQYQLQMVIDAHGSYIEFTFHCQIIF